MDEWIKKICVYIYNGILFGHEKEGSHAICDIMDGPWGHYAKWNKSEKDKYDITYMWNLKAHKTKLVENRFVATGGIGRWMK